MTAQVIVRCEKGRLILSPVGRFDFLLHRQFFEAYREKLEAEEIDKIEVNLAEVDYIDSSALSMLLLLREKVLHLNKEVILINCQGMVQHTIDTANFSQLFKVVNVRT